MKSNRFREAPARRPAPVIGRGWSSVHARAAMMIAAEPERLAVLYLDHAGWPSLFPATIRAVRTLAENDGVTVVEVDHRTEARVVNVIRPLSRTVIALDERKPRYEAKFVNRFEPAPGGSCYVVDAAIHFGKPYGLVAPLLGAIVRRRMRTFVLAPMYEAAGRRARPNPAPPAGLQSE